MQLSFHVKNIRPHENANNCPANKIKNLRVTFFLNYCFTYVATRDQGSCVKRNTQYLLSC